MSPNNTLAGRYRLLEPIGQGGMGTVWRAEDGLLGRQVAVKEVRISPDLEPDVRGELLRRTMREARICAKLSHPSIVTVHDVVREGDRPWIVMELLPGRGLDAVVHDDGPLPPHRVAEIGRQLLAALGAAHAAGVLHRDVKPSNVLLLPDGRAVLTDFGIAVADSEERLTLTGRLPGSPGYLAPERLVDGTMTPASDLWSLGATLYFAVEGRPTHERATVAAQAAAAIDEPPDPARRAGTLEPVLARMLLRDPERRPSGPELDAALAAVAAGGGVVDRTPTGLDVSELTGTRPAAPPGSADAPGSRHRFWKAAGALAGALVSLLLAPLLVEAVTRWLFPDDPPVPTPSPTPSVATTAVPDGFVYHETGGFRLAVPETWSVREGDDGELWFSANDGYTQARLQAVDLDGMTPYDFLDERADAVDGEPVRVEEVEHPAGEAAVRTWRNEEGGVTLMMTWLLVRDDDGAEVLVAYGDTAGDWQSGEGTRDAVLASLRSAD
ncbi:serine/threonine-protein kinase [Marinactinospora rubrisoli]|uniref:non-specific serine/threonine protein kinase n=1 Tax=Marinactinospora rubrisoli TaxID=2715399 RepID=A0ABW2KG98_9ACTN